MSIRFASISLLLTALLSSAGCSYHYGLEHARHGARMLELSDSHSIQRQRPMQIATRGPVCLALNDGMGDPGYHLSSTQHDELQALLASGLTQHFPDVVSLSAMSALAAVEQAQLNQCGLLLQTSFVQFENGRSSPFEFGGGDYVSNWPGTDKLRLKVLAVDVARNLVLDTALLQSRTPFLQLAPHKPEDLLAEAWRNYLERIAPLRLVSFAF